MTKLHLIQQSMTQIEFCEQFERVGGSKDSFLLLNDGIHTAFELNLENLIESLELTSSRILVIDDQIAARGLKPLINHDLLSIISFAKFISLCQTSDHVVSW